MHAPLVFAGREHHLRRWPLRRDDPLRAWDTADQYLLDTLGTDDPGRILVIEDDHGALAVPVAAGFATTDRRAGAGGRARATDDHAGGDDGGGGNDPARPPLVCWHDSHLAHLALRHNLEAVGLAPGAAAFVPATVAPPGRFDTVLARFPKSLAAWEDTLRRLRPHLAPGTRIIAGGMIRHTPRRAFELLTAILGPTRTSRGWKKARLAETVLDPDLIPPPPAPDPEVLLPGTAVRLRTTAGVFGRDHLDAGTRALLAHLPAGLDGRLADLGCGNGALAIALARACPAAEILAVDSSHRAAACAKDNARRAGLRPPRLTVAVDDGLASVAADVLGAVVCNPPFHQDRSVGDALAWRMFTQAHRALAPGGELRVVGNRHLDHGRRLARIFGGCERLATTGKFEVLTARRR